MSLDVQCNITRNSQVIYQNVLVQVDRLSEMDASLLSLPAYYSYDCYILRLFPDPPGLHQNDYLVDRINTDPVTGQPKMYQIVDEPEAFPDFHVEFRAIRADRAGLTMSGG